MKPLLAALQFLTTIPVPMQLDKDDFKHATVWFPVVGLLIGVLVALMDLLMVRAGFAGMLSSIVTIGLLAAISGGLHLDGLADTADGFLSARPRERAMEIMRDSQIGTMGVLALIFVLALKTAALAELSDAVRWKAIIFAPVAGRCQQVLLMALLPYARKQGGMASLFFNGNRGRHAVWAALFLVMAAIMLFGLKSGTLLLAGIVIMAVVLSVWSLRRIGGYTGDTVGANSEIAEMTVMVLACGI